MPISIFINKRQEQRLKGELQNHALLPVPDVIDGENCLKVVVKRARSGPKGETERVIDRRAREILSLELGHSRLAIVKFIVVSKFYTSHMNIHLKRLIFKYKLRSLEVQGKTHVF